MNVDRLLQEHDELGAVLGEVRSHWAKLLFQLDGVTTSDGDKHLVRQLVHEHLNQLDESAAALLGLAKLASQDDFDQESILPLVLWT